MKYIDAKPDRIYAGFNKDTHLESYCLEKKGICQTEYIRKDYLLEFVNKKLQESADRLDFHANRAYAEVFDKLNEI